MSIKTYIKQKIKMLRQEFCMNLTTSEIAHLYELKTEVAVDNYVQDLFMRKL